MNPLPSVRAIAIVVTSLLAACAAPVARRAALPEGTRASLVLLESTDLHATVRSFDYYQDKDDPTLGFERMATLVKRARAEFPNTLLFDAGDTIQGTALADWQALVKPVACDRELAIHRAMDALHYDAGTIGNHEFNYGLPFLAQVTGNPMNVDGVDARRCKGPDYPLVLSNVFSTRDDKPIFAPYGWVNADVAVTKPDGRTAQSTIRVGLLGFTPPSIMQWDRRNLEGKVYTKGLVESARQYLPELRRHDVDLVVAISHGGIDTAPYTPQMENANWYLAAEPGIDALLLGHSHASFPDPANPRSRFANLPEVDNQRGFLRGKPAVMGNFWGKSLGVMQLALVRRDGRWQVDPAASHSEVRDIRNADGTYVEPDAAIATLVEPEHAATRAYVATPIGDSDFAMTTYFADVGDVTALQPVNSAQVDYARRYIDRNLPDLRNVPLLSAAAPFKGGFGGPTDYTDIAAGPLAIRSAADLYLYPNTLTAVKIDGAILKGWLERSADRFNRIDPAQTAPQELLNRKFSGYNFDVIQNDIRYAIDVTRPEGSRIRELTYRGAPVTPEQAFIVVTNNYRASGGGKFPGLDGSNIVMSAPDANRDALIDWVRERKHLTRAADGADHSWHFAPVHTAGPVVFTSASAKLALAKAAGLDHISLVGDNGDGTSVYAVDLGAAPHRDE